MIIKIDHIALSSGDFEKTFKTLDLLGYERVFFEQNVPNLLIKRELLAKFSPSHSISLLKCGENLNIEILNHGNINSGKSFIIPIFENTPASFLNNLVRIEDLYSTSEKNYGFNADIQVLNKPDCSGFIFTKIKMLTENILDSVIFWKHFGFKLTTCTDESAILEFSSIINRNPYQLHLKRVEHVKTESFLDDAGFNCIAFVSTSLKRDMTFFKDQNIPITDIGTLTLDNKKINLFFCKGLYGEPIEIVEVLF